MKNKIKNSIIFTTLVFLLMYAINKFIFAVSVLKDILNSDSGSYYEWRFGNVYYTKQGFGSPILLIHDINSYSSSYEWNEIVQTLSKTHTVYTLDLLGCGRSDKPNITYTNYLYVQLITDFIKNIIRHRTDVISTGLSSSFVVMACFNDDSLFDKIMMVNPKSLSDLNKIPTKRSKIYKLLIEAPIIGTFIYNIIMNEKNVENIFLEKYFFNPFKVKQKYIHSYYEAAHLGGANAKYLLSSLKGNYLNVSVTRSIKEINNSIFIAGGSEEPNMDNIMKEYQEYNPAIETARLADIKHLPQLEKPEMLLEHIQVFFYHRMDTL